MIIQSSENSLGQQNLVKIEDLKFLFCYRLTHCAAPQNDHLNFSLQKKMLERVRQRPFISHKFWEPPSIIIVLKLKVKMKLIKVNFFEVIPLIMYSTLRKHGLCLRGHVAHAQ